MIQHRDDSRCCCGPAEAGGWRGARGMAPRAEDAAAGRSAGADCPTGGAGSLDALDRARVGHDAAHGQPVARAVCAGGSLVSPIRDSGY